LLVCDVLVPRAKNPFARNYNIPQAWATLVPKMRICMRWGPRREKEMRMLSRSCWSKEGKMRKMMMIMMMMMMMMMMISFAP